MLTIIIFLVIIKEEIFNGEKWKTPILSLTYAICIDTVTILATLHLSGVL